MWRFTLPLPIKPSVIDWFRATCWNFATVGKILWDQFSRSIIWPHSAFLYLEFFSYQMGYNSFNSYHFIQKNMVWRIKHFGKSFCAPNNMLLGDCVTYMIVHRAFYAPQIVVCAHVYTKMYLTVHLPTTKIKIF